MRVVVPAPATVSSCGCRAHVLFCASEWVSHTWCRQRAVVVVAVLLQWWRAVLVRCVLALLM